MSDIFISYANGDRERVAAIVAELEKLGWQGRIWWDRHIPPGETWEEVLERTLEAAGCVVVLWSKESVQSRWVKLEANYGVEKGMMIPAILDDVKIPLTFRYIHAANLVGWRAAQANADWNSLIAQLRKKVPPATPPPGPEGQGGLSARKENPKHDNWIWIEGGTFWMGAQSENPKGRNYDPEASDDEAPVHHVKVEGFYLQKYPVTVEEYGRFVEAGGYIEKRWWAAGGWGNLQEPEQWLKQQKFPNRPVTGVNWYEAMAYCEWRSAESGWEVRLPTEEEWEYAARGTAGGGAEARRYPWGGEQLTRERANYYGGPGHPTPVGLYPLGATPEGVEDMIGNVWEWCSSEVREYGSAGNSASDRGTPARVLRGGSWGHSSQNARASLRVGDDPTFRDVSVGFRCTGVKNSLES